MEYHQADPAVLSERQVRDYLEHCRDDKKWKHHTLKIALTALKAFYTYADNTTWNIWDYAKPPRVKPERIVITPEEIQQIINTIREPHLKICVTLIASCGLRIGEAVRLKPLDLKQRPGFVFIREGKGQKDRYVPVPDQLLERLREYWKTHGNRGLLFPGGRNLSESNKATTKTHISLQSIQRVIRLVREELRIDKPITPHTFRHSYATNMLDAGMNVRVLASYMGHESLETTLQYLHLTPKSQEAGKKLCNQLGYQV